MTTTHTNLALVEGEAYILKQSFISKRPENINYSGVLKINFTDNTFGYYFLYEEETFQREIIASTAKLEGVTKLDRKHFVKPKVDVEELAEKWVFETNGHKWSNNDDTAPDNYASFKSGYNFKEAEFTREEAIALFNEGCRQGTGNYPLMTFDRCVEILRPISLPKSVTLNENNEVISVEW